MDLTTLNGDIIGIIDNSRENGNYSEETVEKIIKIKVDDALKMINMPLEFKQLRFKDLSCKEQNKVLLASKLHDKTIILYDFTKGMLARELAFYKNLFKRISQYGKKIILVGNDIEFLLNLVDKVYVMDNGSIIYQTDSFWDLNLYKYVDRPKIIDFVERIKDKGIKIDNYTDLNELLKAIYRLKS